MDAHHDIVKVIGFAFGAAVLLGALVGEAIDVLLHRHRSV